MFNEDDDHNLNNKIEIVVEECNPSTTETTNLVENDQNEEINSKFHKKLTNLLLKYNLTSFEASNIWMLNQLIIPLSLGTSQNSNQLKPRYQTPENDFTIYNSTVNIDINNVSIDENLSTIKSTSKLHIHTCYAFNQLGSYSLPLVVFPTSELDSNVTDALKKTALIDETHIGDLSETIFLNWLKIFVKTNKKEDPLILMCNSILPINSRETIEFCVENSVYLLFYPQGEQLEVFNKNIFIRFKDVWKIVLQQYSMKDNPNSQLAFLLVYKQVLRKILTSESTRECFREFIKTYNLPSTNLQPDDEAIKLERQSSTASVDSSAADLNFISDDCNPTAAVAGQSIVEEIDDSHVAVAAVSSNSSNNIKISEQESNEYCDWIKFMSKIGCLCVRYTFLRDLNLKHRSTLVKSTKEVIASEKKWLELIKKNRAKFNDPMENSYCFNEDEYLAKWFDIDIWRFLYYKLLKEKKIVNPASIWTFDIIQFPCVLNNGNLLRAPERDLNDRPRNLKPRISVLFAFNAAGDYIQPFIVYPLNFQGIKLTNGEDDEDDIAANECYAQNGYITCKIFNQWLSTVFLPYIQRGEGVSGGEENYLLLYCGKLAVVDHANMKILNENRVNLFGLTHDSIQPFNCLFQKSLRKRQTDLFLDSWRKITAKQNLSYQFKCKSKLEFRNLFMDTFQNCIEEIGDFKLKLQNTFEICQLWPINEDDEFFKTFLINGELALNRKQKLIDSMPISIVQNEALNEKSMMIVTKLEPIKKMSPVKIKKEQVLIVEKDKIRTHAASGANKRPRNGGNNIRRKSKANSCSDEEYDEEEEDEEEDEEESIEEEDEEDDYYENGLMNGNDTSDDEFIPTSHHSAKRKRPVSESPILLTKQQKKQIELMNKRLKLEQQRQEELLLLEQPQIKTPQNPILKRQQSGSSVSCSLIDLLKRDSSLAPSIKSIISTELIKYFNEDGGSRDRFDNEIEKLNLLINDLLNGSIQLDRNSSLIEDNLSVYFNLSQNGRDLMNREEKIEEDLIVNNINFKMLTNELLSEFNVNLNAKLTRDLGELYKNNLNDGLKFLRELCGLFNNNNENSSLMTMCNNNYDLRFNFIKKLMLNLYSNDFETNWSKFISIIDENLLL